MQSATDVHERKPDDVYKKIHKEEINDLAKIMDLLQTHVGHEVEIEKKKNRCESSKKYYQEHKDDPKFKKNRSEYNATRYSNQKNDPNHIATVKANSQKQTLAYQNDPEYRAANLMYQRKRYHARKALRAKNKGIVDETPNNTS